MNPTISITPRAFGNIAAKAISHGCDVTTFLVRAAIQSAPAARKRPAAAVPAAQAELPLEPAAAAQPTAQPELVTPAPAPTTGMLFN